MRQVFTSARLENVEGVARLLNDHGIDTWISEGRSYKGARRRQFSFRDGAGSGPQPAVWIVKAEDQPLARELLREAGLIDSTRPTHSYVPAPLWDRGTARSAAGGTALRIRLVLLAAIALGAGLILFRLL